MPENTYEHLRDLAMNQLRSEGIVDLELYVRIDSAGFSTEQMVADAHELLKEEGTDI